VAVCRTPGGSCDSIVDGAGSKNGILGELMAIRLANDSRQLRLGASWRRLVALIARQRRFGLVLEHRDSGMNLTQLNFDNSTAAAAQQNSRSSSRSQASSARAGRVVCMIQWYQKEQASLLGGPL
jgi:hypothetical protein